MSNNTFQQNQGNMAFNPAGFNMEDIRRASMPMSVHSNSHQQPQQLTNQQQQQLLLNSLTSKQLPTNNFQHQISNSSLSNNSTNTQSQQQQLQNALQIAQNAANNTTPSTTNTIPIQPNNISRNSLGGVENGTLNFDAAQLLSTLNAEMNRRGNGFQNQQTIQNPLQNLQMPQTQQFQPNPPQQFAMQNSQMGNDFMGNGFQQQGYGAIGQNGNKKSYQDKQRRQPYNNNRNYQNQPQNNQNNPVIPFEKGTNYTTIMLRNIPNKFSPQCLLDTLVGEWPEMSQMIDFFYLPTDFDNRCNLGYAFINFADHEASLTFKAKFDKMKLPGYKTHKVCEVTMARVQGFKANVEHFRNSSVMGVLAEEYKPMIFQTGVQQPFPKPDGDLPPVRPRFNIPTVVHTNPNQMPAFANQPPPPPARTSQNTPSTQFPRNFQNNDAQNMMQQIAQQFGNFGGNGQQIVNGNSWSSQNLGEKVDNGLGVANLATHVGEEGDMQG